MAYFQPLRSSVPLSLRVLDQKPTWSLIAQLQFVLFCTSTPPRRFTLTLAAYLPTSHVDRDPPSEAPRI